MRRILVLVMVVLALAAVAGVAGAEHGGEIPPIQVTSSRAGR
ncbi:MAG: hypothetical protein ACOY93_08450 [Bacillota bacterium]